MDIDYTQSIVIDEEKYCVIDTIEGITIADSFVLKNKTGDGHGEARLYIGPQKDTHYDDFFENFKRPFFFLKQDFSKYLDDAAYEYKNMEQHYKHDISVYWENHVSELNKRSEDVFYFSMHKAVGDQDSARYYIRSEDEIYGCMRLIALPQISYLSVLKLKKVSDSEVYFYCRLFLDYTYNSSNHPKKIARAEKEIADRSDISATEKEQLTKARIGQGKFRENLLKESVICPLTDITDDRLLVASHIKPWAISDAFERTDFKNGLLLTPTYDKLFNDGYISFHDDGTVLISPYISPLTVKKLKHLLPNKKYMLPKTDGRDVYLKYHRENIFKG